MRCSVLISEHILFSSLDSPGRRGTGREYVDVDICIESDESLDANPEWRMMMNCPNVDE